MITEDYVSFETAKLLKEKRFNDKCRAFWKVWNGNTTLIECNSAQVFDSCYNSTLEKYNDEGELNIAAPTLQMVMKWLREVHHLHCAIGILYKDGKIIYFPNVDSTECSPNPEEEFVQEEYHSEEYFYSYEQACEAAIKYCLENLI